VRVLAKGAFQSGPGAQPVLRGMGGSHSPGERVGGARAPRAAHAPDGVPCAIPRSHPAAPRRERLGGIRGVDHQRPRPHPGHGSRSFGIHRADPQGARVRDHADAGGRRRAGGLRAGAFRDHPPGPGAGGARPAGGVPRAPADVEQRHPRAGVGHRAGRRDAAARRGRLGHRPVVPARSRAPPPARRRRAAAGRRADPRGGDAPRDAGPRVPLLGRGRVPRVPLVERGRALRPVGSHRGAQDGGGAPVRGHAPHAERPQARAGHGGAAGDHVPARRPPRRAGLRGPAGAERAGRGARHRAQHHGPHAGGHARPRERVAGRRGGGAAPRGGGAAHVGGAVALARAELPRLRGDDRRRRPDHLRQQAHAPRRPRRGQARLRSGAHGVARGSPRADGARLHDGGGGRAGDRRGRRAARRLRRPHRADHGGGPREERRHPRSGHHGAPRRRGRARACRSAS